MIQKPTAPTCTPPPRNEGRLTSWQNAPTNPTSTDQYLYDGEGNRVEQKVANDGTTTTVYIGDLETVATSGSTTTTTTYYYAAGRRIALAVNGTFSYLASDLLGSATLALDASGTPTASQLYAPYGGLRYSTGTMPTDYGFTGQRADSTTGLDYYGARYYDPTLGQFASADTVLQGGGFSICGLNRYGYVKGNPETLTDPSGNCPQRPLTRWQKFLIVSDIVLQAIAAWVTGHAGDPTGEARAAHGDYGGTSRWGTMMQHDEPQQSDTASQTRNAVTGSGGDDCDENSDDNSSSGNRPTRRGSTPSQPHGAEATNGIRGPQVVGNNATNPIRLRDGSFNRFQFEVYMKRLAYHDRQVDGFLADSGYTPPQPNVYPVSPSAPSTPGWVPWAVAAGCLLLCPGIVGGLIALDIVAPEVGVPLDVALAGVLITSVSASDAAKTNPHALAA